MISLLAIDVLTYDVFKCQVDIKRRQHVGLNGLDVVDNQKKGVVCRRFCLIPFPAATIAVQEQPLCFFVC